MASSTSFQQVLGQVNRVGCEIENHLRFTRKSSRNGLVEDAKAEIEFPEALQTARKKLANAAAQLLQLTTDPKEYLEQLSANNQHLVCLRWIVNLGILQHVPVDGSILYADLATKAGVPEYQLKSVVRMAAAHGFLLETSPSHVSHSRTSALVATDESFLNWARWLTNYSVPSAYHFADATQKWGKTEEKNQTAFNIAMDVPVPFFGYLKANAKMNSMFSSYMRNVASSESTSFKHMLTGFDWGSLAPGATVVDVGGSGGHGSRAIAGAFPGLKFIVQDLPDTIANAKTALAGDPSIADDRIQFMPHDFFTPQPVTDADIYLLRMIIHDWPDESAMTILSHIRDALKKPGARIVVMDTILPQPGAISLLQERQMRVRDLTMMQVFNAKEREFDTWKDLLERVGLQIINVQQPEGSTMGLLEIGLAGQDSAKAVHSATNLSLLTNSVHKSPATNGVKVNGTNGINRCNGINDTQGPPPPTAIINGVHASPLAPFEQAQDDMPVLIMGAGISGLCLAQNLHKHSIPFVVFERDPSDDHRPQGYRLKLEADAAAALQESLTPEVYQAFEASCAESYIGETDFDPVSGACIKSRAGGGLAGSQGLRASYTVDRSIFRKVLMTGIQGKIHFGRELASYKIDSEQSRVTVTFKDGSAVEGRFLVGADGTRSGIRKQLVPHHKFLDTGAICIYGKTNMTTELLERYPSKALRWMTVCADTAPLIQSILIGESPLTLLSEPIRFSPEIRAKATAPLPEDYVYWVLIGRREMFTDGSDPKATSYKAANSEKAFDDESARMSAAQSLALTGEWHPSLRSLFELQDVRQASTMRVVTAPPKIPAWETSPCVTLMGDAVHAMSPCGGVGANTALRDAAELGKLFAGVGKSNAVRLNGEGGTVNGNGPNVSAQFSMAQKVAEFEDGLRKRAFAGIMRSFVGSKRMFDQKPFEALAVVED